MRIQRREFLAGTLLRGPASAAGTAEPIREGLPLEGIDIVDMHGHFGPAPEGAIWPHALAAVLEDYDRCGIRKAVLSHFDAIGATSAADFRQATAESAEAVRAHRDRLRAHLVFHPAFLKESLAAMADTARPASPFIGFKLHTELHRHEPGSPSYQELYRFAHDNAMPVLVHVGSNVREWIPAAQRIAKGHPKMPLVIAHLGGGEEQTLALFGANLPNLFVDTCGSFGAHRMIERLVAKVGAERILFATDGGYLSPGAQLARIAFADISEAAKRAILGGNAKQVYGRRLPE
jgi:predicted TIM-barrel fold metal-dependent hydrolase